MPPNSLDWFPFYPEDYLNDPAVMAMAADSEGCYIRLLARSWKSPTPGRIPLDLVPEMAGLHRIAPDRLPTVTRQVGAAFEVDGCSWVQKRMVAEYEAAVGRTEARHRGAATTNQKRWGSLTDRSAIANRVAQPSLSGRYARVDVGVDSTYEEAEESEPSTNGQGKAEESESAEVIPGIGEETKRQWSEGFEWFWEGYPRKVGKESAKSAYLKIRPRCQETFDALMAGLAWYKTGEWADRDQDKIPHASTWINQRRWLDAEAHK